MSLPAVVSREHAHTRLASIFPSAAFDPALSNPLAAAAAATMLYVGAVENDDEPLGPSSSLVRPTTCLWMQNEVLEHTATADREAWFAAATSHSGAKNRTENLVRSWGLPFKPWYGDNTRESLRDETFPGWAERGAVRKRHDLPTTSSHPRWAMSASFAALFDPDLVGRQLSTAIDDWRSTHMEPLDLLRISTNVTEAAQQHAVAVRLPNGTIRHLEAGAASLILKGIVEQWAPARLRNPVVLTISEPGDKVFVADAATLASIGVSIDTNALLPDALIIDIGQTPPQAWVVEAVATDGPVTESRKSALLEWAKDQRISPEGVRFVSAFQSRVAPAARRRLKDLAVGTTAWFLDEPDRELSWHELKQI